MSVYTPSVRGDAMLVTHAKNGGERLIAAALLLDAVLGGQLDVLEGRRVVAGREDGPPLLADLRSRVLSGSPGSPHEWIVRAAAFAPHRVAAELVAAGVASPLSPRFQRRFALSVDARAEAQARARVLHEPVLAGLLHACGLPTGDPFPPDTRALPAAARSVLHAVQRSAAPERTHQVRRLRPRKTYETGAPARLRPAADQAIRSSAIASKTWT